MESEDDMHDTEELESLDDFYSGGTGADSDDADDNYELVDNDSDGSDDSVCVRQQQNYSVLCDADIYQRQEDDISLITAVLSISRVSASILLRYYNWNVNKVYDAWFADEDKVRKDVGLLEKPVSAHMLNATDLTCGICFETYPQDLMNATTCGHPFCCDCWRGYISTAINDGPGCLMLRCPDPSCGASVGHDMISILVSDDEKMKYSRYLLRSYIEDSKTTKWCPAPGCEYAVDYIMGSGNYDVTCNCSYNFCWNCTEEAHRPVDCGTVAMWILKNSAESENMNWILANSKPCPKCKRPIEKNQGCMHITCTPPCKFEFCWLCLGAWSEHGERTGGFYACNRYETAKQEGVYDEAERRREMAKNSLERYTHYYERWATNQSDCMSGVSSVLRRQLFIIRCLGGPHYHPHEERMFDAKLLSGSSLEADAMNILRAITPSLDPKLHKGQAGKVAIIGGCREYTGAPYFAAISALKIGADLSHVFCTKDAATVIKGYSPELIVHPVLEESYSVRDGEKVSVGDKVLHEVSKWMERFDCLVIGPGLGRDPFLLDCVSSIVKCAKQSNVPIVIDGDGLFLVTNDLDLVRGYPLAVLTPNVNEYKRLVKKVLDSEVNDEDSPGQLLSLSKSIGGVSVLRKGKVDLISDGEAVHTVSLYGSPRRCGGQGDILSGSVAVFSSWALHKTKVSGAFLDERYKNPMVLGCIAASALLRKAALAAFEKNKRSTLTTDIIEHLGESLESICPAL